MNRLWIALVFCFIATVTICSAAQKPQKNSNPVFQKESSNSVTDGKELLPENIESDGGEDPFRRDEEYWKQRVYPFDKIPDGALERADAATAVVPRRHDNYRHWIGAPQCFDATGRAFAGQRQIIIPWIAYPQKSSSELSRH